MGAMAEGRMGKLLLAVRVLQCPHPGISYPGVAGHCETSVHIIGHSGLSFAGTKQQKKPSKH